MESNRTSLRLARHMRKCPSLDTEPQPPNKRRRHSPLSNAIDDQSVSLPSLSVGEHVIFKERASARIMIGTVLAASSSPPDYQIHCFIHQSCPSIPKIHGLPRINIFHPIASRRLLYEWRYFKKGIMLTYGSKSRNHFSHLPVTISITSDTHDVLAHGSNLISNSSNNKRTPFRISKTVCTLLYRLVENWNPDRGTTPLGIFENDASPKAAS